MAFGRLERRKADAPISDINMTPLIDVMLVLLVIFMITAPLMTSSLKLDLPQAEGAAPTEQPPAALQLGLKADGVLYWDEQPVDAAAFAQRLAQFQTRGGEQRPEVMLRADQAVPYGRVAALIGQLQQAGLSRIAFITETPSTWAGDR
jgi:biopolymer transport protein ExbD/biopolymer transport protein TolR